MILKHKSFGLNKVNQMKTTLILSIMSLDLDAFGISQEFPWRVVSTSPIVTMIWTKLAKHVSRDGQMHHILLGDLRRCMCWLVEDSTRDDDDQLDDHMTKYVYQLP